MRRIGLLALALALVGCADKPRPQPIDDPPALHPPDPVPVADGTIPPPRPLLREPTADHIVEGRQLFLKMQCDSCHSPARAKGPALEGLYGKMVQLKHGEAALADDWYLIESIRNPKAKVVAGWNPVMPAFDAEYLPAEQLSALVAYLRGLKKEGAKGEAFPAPVGPPK